jgi:hypothetical protein
MPIDGPLPARHFEERLLTRNRYHVGKYISSRVNP